MTLLTSQLSLREFTHLLNELGDHMPSEEQVACIRANYHRCRTAGSSNHQLVGLLSHLREVVIDRIMGWEW